jgi:hypothetical protein
MAILKLSIAQRRKITVFFTCLLVAVAGWIIMILSSPSTYNVKIAVTFTGVPSKKSFKPLQNDTLVATVNGTGWSQLFEGKSQKVYPIEVSLKNLDNRNYIILKDQLKDINAHWQLPQQPITRIMPDTLYFDFETQLIKKVPVKLLSRLEFDQQYGLDSPLTIKPAYVTISGPAEQLAKIKEWKTDSLNAAGLSETTSYAVNLQTDKDANISIFPKTVTVTLPIAEFTEKELWVPIKIINNRRYYNVQIFPKKVKVVFTVALNQYAKIDESNFEAVADMNLWIGNGYTELPVKLIKAPTFCKIARIEPQTIDFIIKP